MEKFGTVRMRGEGIAVFPGVTRATVVGDNGLLFERYDLYGGGVEVHIQDGGRTIKVFPLRPGGFW